MSSAIPYVYSLLSSPRSIRLLKLEPAQKLQDDLHCTLKEVSLDDDPLPNYTTLSYCWEGSNLDMPIYCDSGGSCSVLRITKNCLAALRRLREEEELTVWVDSICINQTSLLERNIQVALMGEIYKFAEKVIVWLGEWDDSARKATKVLNRITGGIPGPLDKTEDIKKRMHAAAAKLSKSRRGPDDDCLDNFFQRSWFSRMWTAQEVSLAKGYNVILYGGPGSQHRLDWPILVAAVDALSAMKYTKVDLSMTRLHKYLAMEVMYKRSPSLKAIYDSNPGDIMRETSVMRMLQNSRGKGATDVKDKVFALYGVLKELGITADTPDYSKSVEDIYREITVSAINHDKYLYVLYEAPSDFRHLRPKLASWVPDWSSPGWSDIPTQISRVAVLRDRFCAAGPSTATWKFSEDKRELCLSGKILDTIIYCGPPLHGIVLRRNHDTMAKRLKDYRKGLTAFTSVFGTFKLESDYHQVQTKSARVLKEWLDISSWNATYPTGETPEQALCRTLFMDTPKMNDPRRLFNRWQKATRRPGSDAMNEHSRFHFLAAAFSDLKTFFITEDGYMGTAPAALQNGDEVKSLIRPRDVIAVVAGLEMPLILRSVHEDLPNVGPFQLVTHAYVHGIMYGEGWEDNTKAMQDLVLV